MWVTCLHGFMGYISSWVTTPKFLSLFMVDFLSLVYTDEKKDLPIHEPTNRHVHITHVSKQTLYRTIENWENHNYLNILNVMKSKSLNFVTHER